MGVRQIAEQERTDSEKENGKCRGGEKQSEKVERQETQREELCGEISKLQPTTEIEKCRGGEKENKKCRAPKGKTEKLVGGKFFNKQICKVELTESRRSNREIILIARSIDLNIS